MSNETEESELRFDRPKHPELRVKLDDVVLNNETGDVTVMITADDASAHLLERVLRENLAGVNIKALSNKTFALSASDPNPHEKSDKGEMVSTAVTLVEFVGMLTRLDLNMEMQTLVGHHPKGFLPGVRLVMKEGSTPSEDFQFVLANVLLNRLDIPEFLELNLTDILGHINTSMDNKQGGTDYMNAYYLSAESVATEREAQTQAEKLVENVAGILCVSNAAQSIRR